MMMPTRKYIHLRCLCIRIEESQTTHTLNIMSVYLCLVLRVLSRHDYLPLVHTILTDEFSVMIKVGIG
jgi:hypothetical protein